MTRSYDIVVVTDPRLTGGGNKSLAEEIRAQAKRGYTTGLLPVASNTNGARPVDGSIEDLVREGLVEWVRPDAGARCRLAVARGPSIFLEPQPGPVRLHAERAVLVANAVHPDPTLSAMAYDPEKADRALADLFGYAWEWAPLSEVVRRELRHLFPDLEISPETWGNIIRVDDWRRPRGERLRRPYRVGRHSRDHPAKWPLTARQVLAAYPAAEAYDVRIMGGANSVRKRLRRLPGNWTVEPFGARNPRAFLADVDVYPYFHHPRMVEAFGRAVLEAVASGAVAVLPPYLEAVFGEGAVYGDPEDVQPLVDRLAADPHLLAERREAGWTTATERYSPATHIERLERLAGPPSAGTSGRAAPSRRSHGGKRSESSGGAERTRATSPRVVFFTDNGHGLGHVSRMLAIATRCAGQARPFILTMSEAFSVAAAAGVPTEYFPSWRRLRLERVAWLELLRVRFDDLLRRLRPALVVVDHVNPAPVLLDVAADRGVATVWVRRGLWRAGKNPSVGTAHRFDHVIEPIDLAAAFDRGATTAMVNPRVHYVRPVSLVDRGGMLPRDKARRGLGLHPDRPAVLINMTADSTDSLAELITRVRDEVVRKRPAATLFAPTHILHTGGLPAVDGVVMRPVYPVARYLRAFDAAVSTAGYNTFHEIVLAGTPAVFTARATGSLDDQALRARTAGLGGFGLHVDDVRSDLFGPALDQVLDPVGAGRMRAAAAVAHPGNGAADAAAVVARIAREVETV